MSPRAGRSAGHRRRRSLALLAATVLLLGLLPCPSHAATKLRQATLMPLWLPQAQFAGYYVARDKGLYAREGIDIRILTAGPGRSPVETLNSGAADFAVLWLMTAIEHGAAGEALVNLAQVNQSSSLMLVTRRTSGIASVREMQGRKVGLWGGDLSVAPRALFARYGVDVKEVAQSGTVNLFLRGGIDVASGTWYNEYHLLLNAGLNADELRVFFLRNEGMDFPEDGLYARADTVRREPAFVDAFVRASLAGWRYAFDHPEEALDIVIREMEAAHVPANRVHQRWMLARVRDLALPRDGWGAFGRLREDQYRAVGDTLVHDHLIRGYAHFATFARRLDGPP